MSHEWHVAEIKQNDITWLKAISLADVKLGVFQRGVPVVVKAGAELLSHNDPWLARIVQPMFCSKY